MTWYILAAALTSLTYRDDILQHHIIPYLKLIGGIFQFDNARPHVLRVSVGPQLPDITLACKFWDLKPKEYLGA